MQQHACMHGMVHLTCNLLDLIAFQVRNCPENVTVIYY
jgi:hypothetical protein